MVEEVMAVEMVAVAKVVAEMVEAQVVVLAVDWAVVVRAAEMEVCLMPHPRSSVHRAYQPRHDS